MGKPCRVTFGDRVFFKSDFIKRFLDTLHLEDEVVDNSPYLKSIGYDNAFNEGDPLLIREKKAEAKAEAEGVAKIYERPEMESPVYRVVVNGKERFIQKVTGNEAVSTGWIEVSKSDDGYWDDIKTGSQRYNVVEFTKAEMIDRLMSESKTETIAPASEASIFDDFDSTNKGKSIKSKAEANKAFKEKYGEDAAVAKAISSNFEAIADELKAKGIFTKIEC